MESLPKRHILIPVDESASSDKVVAWAAENFVREGDAVHLLHVIPPGQYVVLSTDLGLEEIVEDDESTQKKVEDHARSFITSRFVPTLQAKGVSECGTARLPAPRSPPAGDGARPPRSLACACCCRGGLERLRPLRGTCHAIGPAHPPARLSCPSSGSCRATRSVGHAHVGPWCG